MIDEKLAEDGLDLGTLEEIEPEQCWRLLATRSVGRLAVNMGHYPLVFPVNYALDAKTIVFRTGVGTKLHAIHRSNVTFEVDEIDVPHRSGWSVMVKGAAHELSADRNPALYERLSRAGARPWAAGDRHHLLRILVDQISGRRIRPGERPPAAPDVLGV